MSIGLDKTKALIDSNRHLVTALSGRKATCPVQMFRAFTEASYDEQMQCLGAGRARRKIYRANFSLRFASEAPLNHTQTIIKMLLRVKNNNCVPQYQSKSSSLFCYLDGSQIE